MALKPALGRTAPAPTQSARARLPVPVLAPQALREREGQWQGDVMDHKHVDGRTEDEEDNSSAAVPEVAPRPSAREGRPAGGAPRPRAQLHQPANAARSHAPKLVRLWRPAARDARVTPQRHVSGTATYEALPSSGVTVAHPAATTRWRPLARAASIAPQQHVGATATDKATHGVRVAAARPARATTHRAATPAPIPAPDTPFTVFILAPSGRTVAVDAHRHTTAADLKQAAANRLQIPAHALRLAWRGIELPDARQVHTLGPDATLHLLARMLGGSSQPSRGGRENCPRCHKLLSCRNDGVLRKHACAGAPAAAAAAPAPQRPPATQAITLLAGAPPPPAAAQPYPAAAAAASTPPAAPPARRVAQSPRRSATYAALAGAPQPLTAAHPSPAAAAAASASPATPPARRGATPQQRNDTATQPHSHAHEGAAAVAAATPLHRTSSVSPPASRQDDGAPSPSPAPSGTTAAALHDLLGLPAGPHRSQSAATDVDHEAAAGEHEGAYDPFGHALEHSAARADAPAPPTPDRARIAEDPAHSYPLRYFPWPTARQPAAALRVRDQPPRPSEIAWHPPTSTTLDAVLHSNWVEVARQPLAALHRALAQRHVDPGQVTAALAVVLTLPSAVLATGRGGGKDDSSRRRRAQRQAAGRVARFLAGDDEDLTMGQHEHSGPDLAAPRQHANAADPSSLHASTVAYVTALLDNGKPHALHKAAQVLGANRLLRPEEHPDMEADMWTLHPSGPCDIRHPQGAFALGAAAADGLEDRVAKATHDACRLKAAGPSGWTAELLSPLLRDVTCRAALTRLTQCILANDLPEPARQLLLASRLLALRKLPLPRPIAMGEAMTNVAVRIALEASREPVRDAFAPHDDEPLQVALGLPGGSQTAAHLARGMLNNNDGRTGCIMFDVVHCFPNLPRDELFGLLYARPELAGLFNIVRFIYGQPSQAFMARRGACPLQFSSTQGVRQGCVLGMLLCCLFLQHLSRGLLRIMRRISPGTVIINIADAAYLFGPAEALVAAAAQARHEFQRRGLRVHSAVAYFQHGVVPEPLAQYAREHDLQVNRTLFMVGGVPIRCAPAGSAEADGFVQSRATAPADSADGQLHAWLDKLEAKHAAFAQHAADPRLRRQHTLALLRANYLARPVHIARGLVPEELRAGFIQRFDARTRAALEQCLPLTEAERRLVLDAVCDQASLPLRLGGMGLRDIGPRLEPAYLGAAANAAGAAQHMAGISLAGLDASMRRALTASRTLAHGAMDDKLPDPAALATEDGPATAVAMLNAFAHEHADAVPHLQHTLSTAMDETRARAMAAQLPPAHRARLLSCRQPNAHLVVTGSAKDIPPHVWELNLRLRHGLTGLTSTPPVCECGARIDAHGRHFFQCPKLKGLAKARHDHVVIALEKWVQRHGGSAINNPRNIADVRTIPDLLIHVGNFTAVVDVHGHHPDLFAGAANKAFAATASSTAAKKTKYAAQLRTEGLPELTSFAFETYGAVAPEATALMSRLAALVAAHEPAGSKWHYYAELQAAVAAAIAIGNHHIVHTACMRARGRFPAPRSARADLPHDALDNPPPRDHSHVQDGAGGGRRDSAGQAPPGDNQAAEAQHDSSGTYGSGNGNAAPPGDADADGSEPQHDARHGRGNNDNAAHGNAAPPGAAAAEPSADAHDSESQRGDADLAPPDNNRSGSDGRGGNGNAARDNAAPTGDAGAEPSADADASASHHEQPDTPSAGRRPHGKTDHLARSTRAPQPRHKDGAQRATRAQPAKRRRRWRIAATASTPAQLNLRAAPVAPAPPNPLQSRGSNSAHDSAGDATAAHPDANRTADAATHHAPARSSVRQPPSRRSRSLSPTRRHSRSRSRSPRRPPTPVPKAHAAHAADPPPSLAACTAAADAPNSSAPETTAAPMQQPAPTPRASVAPPAPQRRDQPAARRAHASAPAAAGGTETPPQNATPRQRRRRPATTPATPDAPAQTTPLQSGGSAPAPASEDGAAVPRTPPSASAPASKPGAAVPSTSPTSSAHPAAAAAARTAPPEVQPGKPAQRAPTEVGDSDLRAALALSAADAEQHAARQRAIDAAFAESAALHEQHAARQRAIVGARLVATLAEDVTAKLRVLTTVPADGTCAWHSAAALIGCEWSELRAEALAHWGAALCPTDAALRRQHAHFVHLWRANDEADDRAAGKSERSAPGSMTVAQLARCRSDLEEHKRDPKAWVSPGLLAAACHTHGHDLLVLRPNLPPIPPSLWHAALPSTAPQVVTEQRPLCIVLFSRHADPFSSNPHARADHFLPLVCDQRSQLAPSEEVLLHHNEGVATHMQQPQTVAEARTLRTRSLLCIPRACAAAPAVVARPGSAAPDAAAGRAGAPHQAPSPAHTAARPSPAALPAHSVPAQPHTPPPRGSTPAPATAQARAEAPVVTAAAAAPPPCHAPASALREPRVDARIDGPFAPAARDDRAGPTAHAAADRAAAAVVAARAAAQSLLRAPSADLQAQLEPHCVHEEQLRRRRNRAAGDEPPPQPHAPLPHTPCGVLCPALAQLAAIAAADALSVLAPPTADAQREPAGAQQCVAMELVTQHAPLGAHSALAPRPQARRRRRGDRLAAYAAPAQVPPPPATAERHANHAPATAAARAVRTDRGHAPAPRTPQHTAATAMECDQPRGTPPSQAQHASRARYTAVAMEDSDDARSSQPTTAAPMEGESAPRRQPPAAGAHEQNRLQLQRQHLHRVSAMHLSPPPPAPREDAAPQDAPMHPQRSPPARVDAHTSQHRASAFRPIDAAPPTGGEPTQQQQPSSASHQQASGAARPATTNTTATLHLHTHVAPSQPLPPHHRDGATSNTNDTDEPMAPAARASPAPPVHRTHLAPSPRQTTPRATAPRSLAAAPANGHAAAHETRAPPPNAHGPAHLAYAAHLARLQEDHTRRRHGGQTPRDALPAPRAATAVPPRSPRSPGARASLSPTGRAATSTHRSAAAQAKARRRDRGDCSLRALSPALHRSPPARQRAARAHSSSPQQRVTGKHRRTAVASDEPVRPRARHRTERHQDVSGASAAAAAAASGGTAAARATTQAAGAAAAGTAAAPRAEPSLGALVAPPRSTLGVSERPLRAASSRRSAAASAARASSDPWHQSPTRKGQARSDHVRAPPYPRSAHADAVRKWLDLARALPAAPRARARARDAVAAAAAETATASAAAVTSGTAAARAVSAAAAAGTTAAPASTAPTAADDASVELASVTTVPLHHSEGDATAPRTATSDGALALPSRDSSGSRERPLRIASARRSVAACAARASSVPWHQSPTRKGQARSDHVRAPPYPRSAHADAVRKWPGLARAPRSSGRTRARARGGAAAAAAETTPATAAVVPVGTAAVPTMAAAAAAAAVTTATPASKATTAADGASAEHAAVASHLAPAHARIGAQPPGDLPSAPTAPAVLLHHSEGAATATGQTRAAAGPTTPTPAASARSAPTPHQAPAHAHIVAHPSGAALGALTAPAPNRQRPVAAPPRQAAACAARAGPAPPPLSCAAAGATGAAAAAPTPAAPRPTALAAARARAAQRR